MQFTRTTESVVSLNPIGKHLNWKGSSDDGKWTYWDKELAMEVDFNLDEFVVIRAGWDISGWDPIVNSKVWSNQVEKLGEEPFIVQHKGGAVMNGLYSAIKEDVKAKDLNLFRVITAIQDGEIISFRLKGNNSWVFNGLLSGGKDRDGNAFTPIKWREYKIKFDGFTDERNGAVKYRAPKWTQGSAITEEEVEEAITSASLVSSYYSKRAIEQSNLEVEENNDEALPF